MEGIYRLYWKRPSRYLLLVVLCLLVGLYAFQQLICRLHQPTLACPTIDDIKRGDTINCNEIFAGNEKAIKSASRYAWCDRHVSTITDELYLSVTDDCSQFRTQRQYDTYPVTTDELEFPVAFSILMHENVEQFERLLRAVYRRHNLYCIQVDGKASPSVHQAVRSIANCFDNVFIASEVVEVYWGHISLVRSELVCLQDLWKSAVSWKYYINLTGREFPLRTNKELVDILRALNGANDISGSSTNRPFWWTNFVWWGEMPLFIPKSAPPHGFTIYKGSNHVVMSRASVDYVLHSNVSKDLLNWMSNVHVPDEHYLPTLNHNPHMKLPGGYKGDGDTQVSVTRLKIWSFNSRDCHGQWIRKICNIGVGDLPKVPPANQLFLNKVRLEQDPIAYHCLELRHRNRTSQTTSYFDSSFYANLSIARNHV